MFSTASGCPESFRDMTDKGNLYTKSKYTLAIFRQIDQDIRSEAELLIERLLLPSVLQCGPGQSTSAIHPFTANTSEFTSEVFVVVVIDPKRISVGT